MSKLDSLINIKANLCGLARTADELGLWPVIRDHAPSKIRRGLDTYSSYRSDRIDGDDIVQPTNICYNALQYDAREPRFRLLRISRHLSNGRIQCNLEEHKLNAAPEYQALSYCWGGGSFDTPMICDGAQVCMPKTVVLALSKLRLRGCRYVWIDAICINQQDPLERTQQVMIMDRIYSMAHEVCIWLGDADTFVADEFSAKAFKILHSHANDPTRSHEAARSFTDAKNEINDRHEYHLSPVDIAAIELVLGKPWFDRIWCVQEAILNSRTTVICGSNEIRWRTFHNGLDAAIDVDRRTGAYHGRFAGDSLITKRHDGLPEYEPPSNQDNAASYLLKLLFRYRTKKSTDPRDKMYALFGIVRHFFNDFKLSTSYEVPAEEVCKRVTEYIIRETRDLKVLGGCGLVELRSCSAYRSWVPNWSSSIPLPEPLDYITLHGVAAHHASKCSPMPLPLQLSDAGLSIKGLIVDTLSNVAEDLPRESLLPSSGAQSFDRFDQNWGNAMTSMAMKAVQRTWDVGVTFSHNSDLADNKHDVMESLRRVQEYPVERAKYVLRQTQVLLDWEALSRSNVVHNRYAPEHQRETAYWSTLCAGGLCDDEEVTSALYHSWRHLLRRLHRTAKSAVSAFAAIEDQPSKVFEMRGPMQKLDDQWSEWQQAHQFSPLLKYAYNRRFAMTSKGRYCLVPPAARDGDLIGLFAGADVPLVVREYGDDWQIVGQCYVHGIMQGEVWDEQRCKTFRFR